MKTSGVEGTASKKKTRSGNCIPLFIDHMHAGRLNDPLVGVMRNNGGTGPKLVFCIGGPGGEVVGSAREVRERWPDHLISFTTDSPEHEVVLERNGAVQQLGRRYKTVSV